MKPGGEQATEYDKPGQGHPGLALRTERVGAEQHGEHEREIENEEEGNAAWKGKQAPFVPICRVYLMREQDGRIGKEQGIMRFPRFHLDLYRLRQTEENSNIFH